MPEARTWGWSSIRAWRRTSSRKPETCAARAPSPATDGSGLNDFWWHSESAGGGAGANTCPGSYQERGLRGPESRVVWHGDRGLSALETRLVMSGTDRPKI